MKIVFTVHAKDKLKTEEVKLLKINRKKLINILKQPVVVDKSIEPHRNVGKLDETLSLAVIWKVENGIIKIITFYPAEKGRYESKVL